MTEPRDRTRMEISYILQLEDVLQSLQRINSRRRILGQSARELGALDLVMELLEKLDWLQLAETEQAARDQFADLIERMERVSQSTPHATLGQMADDLRDIAADLKAILRDEASRRSVFVVPYEKDEFTERLLRDPRVYFNVDPAHPWPAPDHGLQDLQEAVECYATGHPAAAIVFSLRATEAFLRQFHFCVVGSPPKKTATWAYVMSKLPEISPDACDRCIREQMDLLRERRNGTMHAGMRDPGEWDFGAAKQTFARCRDAISAMWHCPLARANPSSTSPSSDGAVSTVPQEAAKGSVP